MLKGAPPSFSGPNLEAIIIGTLDDQVLGKVLAAGYKQVYCNTETQAIGQTPLESSCNILMFRDDF